MKISWPARYGWLLILLLLQGCAVAVVGGGALVTKVAIDSRAVGVQLDDSGLSLRARSVLGDIDALEGHRVRVVAYDSQVLLVGQVGDQELKDKAEAALAELEGMQNLYNQLRVRDRASLSDRADDSWITTRVKSRLLSHSGDDLGGVKVVTENNEVFLLGIVPEEAAAAAIDIARNTSRVARVIDLMTHPT